ncbi:MAG: GTP-binding protein [Candidatus Helarchaeota archaeon]|nr:GTP-binding protein [Candidatus Helarchaeota archaeon]
MSYSKVLKFVIGGDGGIGKTTLVKSLCTNEFVDQIMTIGVDIHSKDVTVNGTKVNLQVWDLSGQDQFRFLLDSFTHGANGIILGFDCSRPSSFLNLTKWLEIFRSTCSKAPILLIATKLDKGYHLTLSREMAQEYIKTHDLIGFIETSSKEFWNVYTPFRRLLEHHHDLEPDIVPIIFEGEKERPKKEEEPVALDATYKEPDTLDATNLTVEYQKVSNSSNAITCCPQCNTPLRDSQIKLKKARINVTCHNCLILI